MRLLLTLVVLIAVALGGIYFASPYYAVHSLVQSARAGDARAVANYVDFPAVRASLKPQLQGYLQDELAKENAKPHSLWDQLKLAVAPYVAGPATDLLVSPENVAAMVRTGKPPHLTGAVDGKPSRLADDDGPGDSRELHAGYVGDDLDQFRVEVASRAHPSARVKLRLLRRGFFSWKVVSLELHSLPHTKAQTPAA